MVAYDYLMLIETAKNATHLLQIVNSTGLLQLNKLCNNKRVIFIKWQQACGNVSFADLLQLVETTCNKPVDDKLQ